MKKQSFFISFEGLEGSGKSTQIAKLVKKLKTQGYEVVATREPGGTPIGEKIRKITHDKNNSELTAKTEAYLMSAARAQHVEEVIKPALKQKKIVICDRFLDSSLAYQGYGRKLGVETIEELNRLAVDDLMPDLTVYLDITPEEGTKRRNGTNKLDRLDLQSKEFYSRVYAGYRQLLQKNRGRFLVLDAEDTPENIATLIWEEVEKKLKEK